MNELINQYIGALLSVLMPDSFPKEWRLCNETGLTVGMVKDYDLVVLLEYLPQKRIMLYYNCSHSEGTGTVKVLTTQGEIGYMPAKFILYPQQQGNNHE